MNLISKKDLAAMGGVTINAITMNCKSRWNGAWHEETNKVDIDNPVVKKWLKKSGYFDSSNHISSTDFDSLTVGQIKSKFSHLSQFEALLKVRSLVIKSELDLMKMELARGELVNKKLVGDVCFSLVDEAYKKLLDEGRGLAGTLRSLVVSNVHSKGKKKKSDAALDIEISKVLSNTLGKLLSNSKDQIIKTLESDGSATVGRIPKNNDKSTVKKRSRK